MAAVCHFTVIPIGVFIPCGPLQGVFCLTGQGISRVRGTQMALGQPDAVVVGGGIVGASVAMRLASTGRRVTLVDSAATAGALNSAGTAAAPTRARAAVLVGLG